MDTPNSNYQHKPHFTQMQLIDIASHFLEKSCIREIIEIQIGNINDTYLVTFTNKLHTNKYILQRLNMNIFPSIQKLMNNYSVVSDHLVNKLNLEFEKPVFEFKPICLLQPKQSESSYLTKDESIWRMMNYIEGYCITEMCNSSDLVFQIGYGLGTFHFYTHDLSHYFLEETINDFHVLSKYLASYDSILNSTLLEDNHKIEFCSHVIHHYRSDFYYFEHALSIGAIHKSVVHGDPKISNFIFDSMSDRFLSLIDLDTVSPGLIYFDLGDCVRSCCNLLGEDTQLFSDVEFDINSFELLFKGYLSTYGSFISVSDIEPISEAVQLLPFELGVRFFTDYLCGNTNFKTNYPSQNLDRAYVQFLLYKSILSQKHSIISILNDLIQ